MRPNPPLAVWSPWALHADALVAVLLGADEGAVAVGDPEVVTGVLVVGAEAPGVLTLVRRRARLGRETIVWGGTLAQSRTEALRKAGASAYVSALALPGELVEAVRLVRSGGEVEWPVAESSVVPLTARELEVARAYLVTGAERTRAEVAAGLGLSERTVKAHVARIRDKVGHEGTSTREGLRHEMVRWGLFH